MSHAATPPFSLKRRRLLAAALTTASGVCSIGTARAAVPTGAAPDFTLRTTEGRNMRLQEQRGRVVMVNFWATWCGPCKQEMPHLNHLYEKYRSAGFVLMGVNVDEDARNATSTAAKLGVTFPVLLDAEKKVVRLYDLNTMPSTVIIDRDGQVRHLHRGYREGYEQTYDQQIRELLKS